MLGLTGAGDEEARVCRESAALLEWDLYDTLKRILSFRASAILRWCHFPYGARESLREVKSESGVVIRLRVVNE